MAGLPVSGSTWPPRPYDQVLSACQERQIWWEGDPVQLAAYYGTGSQPASTGRIARAWRGFWNKPEPAASEPKRLHVPVAADIGRVAASTLFSQPPTFRDPSGNKDVQDRVDKILNIPDMHSRLLVAAESSSMLSGSYGRVVWDQDVHDHTWIDFVDADRAIPTFKWGRLTEVSFWTVLASPDDSRAVWRHIEHHSKGKIEHALYKGDKGNIGKRIEDLASHEATKGLMDVQPTMSDGLTAAYFPNHRPNAQWRNEPELRHLGRSDLSDDVIHLLDACDETWSSLMRDLQIGKGRIIISNELLQVNGAGKGTSFNLDQALFSTVGTAMKDSAATSIMEAQQFDIRVEEHLSVFDALLRRTISRAGYSPLTFGLQDEAAVTATETNAKERDTNATRSAKSLLWSPLGELARVQMQVEAAIFKGPQPTEEIEVEFPDSHQEAPKTIAETVSLLSLARAASIESLVRRVNPDWDDKAVLDEVRKIQDDAGPVEVSLPGESNFPGQGPADDDQDAPSDGQDDAPADPFEPA